MCFRLVNTYRTVGKYTNKIFRCTKKIVNPKGRQGRGSVYKIRRRLYKNCRRLYRFRRRLYKICRRLYKIRRRLVRSIVYEIVVLSKKINQRWTMQQYHSKKYWTSVQNVKNMLHHKFRHTHNTQQQPPLQLKNHILSNSYYLIYSKCHS